MPKKNKILCKNQSCRHPQQDVGQTHCDKCGALMLRYEKRGKIPKIPDGLPEKYRWKWQ